MSDDVRLQNALAESKQQEDKYQASHPNLRKMDTSGKHRHILQIYPRSFESQCDLVMGEANLFKTLNQLNQFAK